MTVWAFLDESGEPNLDVAGGGSTHFVIGAAVVPDSRLAEIRRAADQVRATHFQTGQIKSRTVGGNLSRRLAIIDALAATGCRVLGLVVDKRALDPNSGLKYRASFVKFVSRFMYDRLFRAFPTLRIVADTHGRPQFMDSFRAYLSQRWSQVDMFSSPPRVEFAKAGDDVLVQVADFVAGSLRIAYSDGISDDDARAILSRMRSASLGIQEWPPSPRTVAALPTAADAADVDRHVRAVAERSAHAFLAAECDADEQPRRMQVEVLQELMLAARSEDPPFLSADALAERLRERGFAECTRDDIRRTVIAPMRDREVLIVSSARGYGLPRGLADIETHLQRMEEEVRPIVRRVQTLDTLLRRATLGLVEVLRAEHLGYLRALVQTHEQFEQPGGLAAGQADGATS